MIIIIIYKLKSVTSPAAVVRLDSRSRLACATAPNLEWHLAQDPGIWYQKTDSGLLDVSRIADRA